MRSRSTLPASLYLVLTAALSAGAAGGEHEMKCYSDGFDRDGDGYAGLNAEDARQAYWMKKWSGELRVNCPKGYVRFYDDCDDLDPAVHPNQAEVALNGRDDDCDSVRDDPSLFYSGSRNTSSSIRFGVRLNARELLDHADELFAQVSYASLENPDDIETSAKLSVHPSDGRPATVEVGVANLRPATVYRARVDFFTRDASGHFQELSPGSPENDWYYTITDGADAEGHARARLVQRGLVELAASAVGSVGYRGSEDVDGTRYGAERNEGWCTEFYVWVTRSSVRGLSGLDTWDDMIDYFRDAHAYLAARDLSTQARPGDYLVMDSDGDGKKNHSGMFLAYEAARDRAWTLEGNSGNGVRVRTRRSEITGIGHLASLLETEGYRPPPPAEGARVPEECRRILDLIPPLERRIERLQERQAGASPSMKAQLIENIEELRRRIDATRGDFRRCLHDPAARVR